MLLTPTNRQPSEQQRRIIWQQSGYMPTALQEAIHLSPERFKLVAGGERGGKSLFSAKELLSRLFWGRLFWIVGPDYRLARPEFAYLVQDLSRLGAIASLSMPNEGPCALQLQGGARVLTRSSSDPEKLAAEPPDGILMVEAAQQSYETYLRLRGRLAEKRGWLAMSGTFESSLGWYAEKFTEWQGPNADNGRSFSLPTWANTAIFPDREQDPEILALKAVYPEDQFLERFGGVPCPPATLVFREFRHSLHVKPCPFDPARPVSLAIDPGYAGAYAVGAVQWDHDQVSVIDCLYKRHTVAEDVIDEAMAKPWWKNVRGGVIDIAGTQHQGMRSHVEIWASRARTPLRFRPVSIAAGILRHRTFLINPATREPRLFHDPCCGLALKEYGLYRYQEVKEARPVHEEPIDANNHLMKALAYWLYDRFGPVEARQGTQTLSVGIR